MTSVRMERARAFRIPNWYLDHMMLLTGACLVPSCHLHMTTDEAPAPNKVRVETLESATDTGMPRHLMDPRKEGAARGIVLHLSPEPRRLNGLASSPAVLIRRGSAASDSEIQSHRAADRRASSL